MCVGIALVHSPKKKNERPFEHLLYYIVAILHAKPFTELHQETLKRDFPKIPLPADISFFDTLSGWGKDFCNNYLLDLPPLTTSNFHGRSNRVLFVRHRPNSIWINPDSYFEGICPEMWEYRVGKYQVLHKWLNDRKKRFLLPEDIQHFEKITKAIRRCVALKKELNAWMRENIHCAFLETDADVEKATVRQ